MSFSDGRVALVGFYVRFFMQSTRLHCQRNGKVLLAPADGSLAREGVLES